ncbi:MAG TPA: N-acetylmuramoyl-L-alanine amidase [Anaerolineae bacterium]|nr:N-acetylmuramoyl-L-alanine amidase [Anaerolineae bacterium]
MLGLFSLKNPRFRLIFIFALAFIIIASVVLIGYVTLLARGKPSTARDDVINAPALVGRDITKARAIASSRGLRIEVEQRVQNAAYPVNYVVTQKPLPNQPIRKGASITITISDGYAYGSAGSGLRQSTATSGGPPPPPPAQPLRSISGMVVVVDAGHQSHANLEREPIGPGATEMKEKVQGGTTGIESKKPEYQVTLEISKRLKSVLESNGIKVVMVREANDVNISNAERAAVANRYNADLFVRIHADGNSDRQKNGISTLYPASNKWTASIHKESLNAARIIQRTTIEATKRKDNGIVERDDISGFNWSKVPAVLVETGFLTNPEEDRLLNDVKYQDLLTSGISKGIIEYLQDSKAATIRHTITS